MCEEYQPTMFGNYPVPYCVPESNNLGNGSQVSYDYNTNPLYFNSTQTMPMIDQTLSSLKNVNFVLGTRKLDAEYLESFITDEEGTRSQTKPIRSSNISEIKTALLTMKSLNKKLIKISKTMKDKDLSSSEWENAYATCEDTKQKIKQILDCLRDENYINFIKQNLEKRKKKRLREKHRRKEWQVQKMKTKERRIHLHHQIDKWIQDQQNIIIREKQVENMSKDADIVLFDVRGKRNDAKKYLTTLKELEHLRNVKVTIAKARGENPSSVANETFNNIIERLVQHWTELDREYSLEEQGLKLMLQIDNELKNQNQKKNSCHEWEIVLFGKKIPNNYFLQGNLETFVMMRTAWDKFLNINRGSPIPVGWIMPGTPSSAAWQKCLKKE